MEISQEKSGSQLVLTLVGRLDASWCDAVEQALSTAIRSGEHHLLLDMAQVDYISSAGLRVLFSVYKQLLAIKGQFGIRQPSKNVESVLRMVGIAQLISEGPAPAPAVEAGAPFSTEQADCETYPLSAAAMTLEQIGGPAVLAGTVTAPATTVRFPAGTVALGLGALGTCWSENAPRLGEFLAVCGAAAFQPADASPRPDFLLSEGHLVPEGQLILGFRAHGEFSTLIRFAARAGVRSVGLSELAATALETSGSDTAVVVAVTEAVGLVGTALRQSVAGPPSDTRFRFPEIRDWLAFSSERSHRDSTSLIVGVVGRASSPCRDLLRPHGSVLGHFHAAAFPYRPLQKGRIDLDVTVRGLFDTHAVAAVLHLLADPREIQGAGESEFTRGALWVAPVSEPSAPSLP
jgi:anti-anti-sigma factor